MKLYSPGSGALVHWLSWWVDNSNVTMVFGGDISLGHGVCKLKTGGEYLVLIKIPPRLSWNQDVKVHNGKFMTLRHQTWEFPGTK